jgi:hypothetical protein
MCFDMRKIAAILLLAIFAFNIVGYQIVYNCLSSQSDDQLEVALDYNKYDDSQLISIKQPINLPYYTNSKTFTRIDGEVEINGVPYKYVKSRIYNDSLEMLCIPHVTKLKIQQSKQAYAAGANDYQQENTQKKTDSKTSIGQKQISEYEELSLFTNSIIVKYLYSSYKIYTSTNLAKGFIKTTHQPPNASLLG